MSPSLSSARYPPAAHAEGPSTVRIELRGVRLLLCSLLVVAVLVPAAVVTRRAERARARIDRHGLDDLRRIYRRDNPRGQGLDPLIQDHRRLRVDPRPVKQTPDDGRTGSDRGT